MSTKKQAKITPKGSPKATNINFLEQKPSNPNAKKSKFGWCDSVTGEVLVSAYGKFTPEIDMDRPNCPPQQSQQIIPTKIVLNMPDTVPTVPEYTMQLVVNNFEPEGVTDQRVTWTSSDTNIATVDSTGRVDTKMSGTVVVTCKSVAAPSVTASITFVIEE